MRLFIFLVLLWVLVMVLRNFNRFMPGRMVSDSVWPEKMAKYIKQGAMVIGVLIVLFSCVRVIPAGHVGVIDFFGRVSDRTLSPGINLVNPLVKVQKYSSQTKEHKEIMQVLSREGLTIGLELSVLYRMDPNKAIDIYKTIYGGNYEEVVLIPQIRSVSRSVTASVQASALYSTEREKLGEMIQSELAKIVETRGIIIESTPLRNVALPPQLTQAIEEKQRADQESQRMEFVLNKEKQEAERKRIEAQGISDFQNIVTKGISEPLLRWKGIEATEKIASSPNTKVIIVGAGKDGLPIILGGQ